MTDLENWFVTDRVGTLKQVLESSGRTEKQLEEDVRILREWLKTQPHLPEIPSENHIINFLLVNKHSIEKCKQNLDMYYTIRTLLPEVFENTDTKNILKEADVLYSIPLPKKTPEGHRVSIIKLVRNDSDDFNIYSSMGYSYSTIDMRLNEDVFTTEILIDDMENLSFGYFQKITVVHLKKIVMILEKVFKGRIKYIIFLNCPPFVYTLITLLKSLLSPKLASRMVCHEDSSKIGEIIPLEILPKDYGGSELSLFELNELWKKKLAQNEKRFDALAKMKTNEKLRPSPLVNDEVLGFHGNFKKLEMD